MVVLTTLKLTQRKESRELKQSGRLEAITGRIHAEPTSTISSSIIKRILTETLEVKLECLDSHQRIKDLNHGSKIVLKEFHNNIVVELCITRHLWYRIQRLSCINLHMQCTIEHNIPKKIILVESVASKLDNKQSMTVSMSQSNRYH